MGAHCNTSSTIDTIRDVHSGVREAGRIADDTLTPLFTNQSYVCLERANDAGYPADSGEPGMQFWRDCMESWMRLEAAVTGMRNSLEELENIYQDIEAGAAGEDDWRYWGARVLDHGRSILRLVRELGVGLDSDILTGLQETLDSLCRLLGCDEEATS
jgi:hypothetical protein